MLTVRSTINFASQSVPPIIPVVQGDPGRAILFTLADFTIPAGATATYYVQKPSGEAVYNNATIDGNNVLVELTAQSIIEKGDNYGQVRIAVGEDVVTSFDFILLVKEFRGIDAVQSLTEMNIFDKAVEQAAEDIDEVKTDALEAIDDAKDEAIEEVTSSLDAITQEFDSVKNTIGDLSGETVTPTATNNYGIGGSVGQVIETWATTMYWHGIYTVSAGNTYGITTVSDFPQQLVVWFTNASNTIIENHKAFATDHVEMVCTAPTGATKLFVMSYGYDAYHGTVQKVEPLSETVSNLKDELNSKIGFGGETQIDMFDPVITTSSSYLANTRRWFVNHIFSAEDTIDTIDYQFWKGSAVQGRIINFEIWGKSGNALTKVDTVSVDVSQSVAVSDVGHGTVDVEYTGATDYMIAVQQEGSPSCLLYQTDTTGADNVLVSTDISKDTTELSYDQLTVFGVKLIPSFTVHYTSKVVGNVVLIGDGQKYAEIQDALNDIADDSETNPYTFLVMPKGAPYKPFSMLRKSFSDTYPWNGVAPRWISIIGMDKAHCVVRSDSGDYAFPCAEPMTNGVISGLTFVMTNDSQTQTATQGGYCLHIDSRTKDDVGYKMNIENCAMEDASGPCLGIGLHENCDLVFNHCDLRTTLDPAYNPHSGYRNLSDFGVVFAHTSTLSDAKNQKITFADCVGVCANGNKAIQIASAGDYSPDTAEFTYTLLRNVFWNKSLGVSGYSISSNLTANPMNFGNNT